MPIQFPSNATTGQTHQTGGQTWIYDGTAWSAILSGATGATGPSANVAVYDEGNLVVDSLTAINFLGPAISANLVNGNVDVTVTATGTGSGGFSYANTAPVTAAPGDRWLHSDTLRELVYIDDGNSSQWIEPIAIGLTGATGPGANLSAVPSSIVPAANVAYDLGTSEQRWRDLYLSGNSIILGAATLSSTGSAINLPAGSTVGGGSIASGGDVATGGGPKITNLQVTDATWTVLDDTAVDTAGGYFVITGSNFVTGCLVYIGQTPATSVAFVSATTVRVTVPATSAGTYPVYLVNPDGGTAIRVPGLTFSANPAWQTASTLPEQYDNTAITLNLVATDATSYTITSGSLPPGLTLNANTGVISGTVTGVTVDTTYTFTVRATDAQLQDSPRTFTVTITVSDPYFKLTTLLLTGNSGNTVIKDSSVNNFNVSVYGDVIASNFHPFHGAWSINHTGGIINFDSGTVPANWQPAANNWTVELWILPRTDSSSLYSWPHNSDGSRAIAMDISGTTLSWSIRPSTGAIGGSSSHTISTTAWTHLALVRNGATVTLYINGLSSSTASLASAGTSLISGTWFAFGQFRYGSSPSYKGYASNFRYTMSAVYTANFTPSTTSLTSLADTRLLMCASPSATYNVGGTSYNADYDGGYTVENLNPFGVTNTGDSGSMYFDGTGDYITVPPSTVYNFGTGNFTVQAWFYINPNKTINGSNGGMIFNYNYEAFQLYYVNDPSYLYCDIRTWGTNIGLTSLRKMIKGTWYHVAIVRDGVSSVKMYLNGILQATVSTNPGSINLNTYNLYSGVRYNPSGGGLDYYHMGYISDLKIDNTALDTSTFFNTKPTAISGTQLLTLQRRQPHNNHSFQDSSSNNFLITRNGNATQGTFSPFSQSGWSAYFDGTGDYLSVADSDAFTMGSGSFTLEAWVYVTATTGSQMIFGTCDSAGNQSSMSFVLYARNSNGYPGIAVGYAGSMYHAISDELLTHNQWNHIAGVRNGANVMVYVNGVQKGNIVNMAALAITDSSQIVAVGRNGAGNFEYLTGYISNARIVKGTAVYTGNFTPPTSPLTAISGTSLLTCQSNRFIDNSSNNFTITRNGEVSVQAFSPFAPTATYSAAVHGGSAYFDGSADYLTVPNSSYSFSFGSSNFSIEYWFYDAGSADAAVPLATAVFNTTGWFVEHYTNSYLGFVKVPYQNRLTVQVNWVSRQWNHVCVQREGSNLYAYVNGTRYTFSTSFSGSMNDNTESLHVGQNGQSWDARNYFTGFLSGVRILKGANIYSGATYTVPTAPATITGNTSVLLNFTNDAIEDATGRNVLETVGDARTTSAVTKWAGQSSMSFDGTGDYIRSQLLSPYWNLTGNFTIEFWIYPLVSSSIDVIGTANNVAYIGSGQTGWVIAWKSSLGLNFGYQSNNTWAVDSTLSATTPIVNTWTHIAVVRNGSTLTGYINGIAGSTPATTSTAFISSLYGIHIGAGAGNQGSILNGYLSDIRVTNGHARYTANFTPATGPARLK